MVLGSSAVGSSLSVCTYTQHVVWSSASRLAHPHTPGRRVAGTTPRTGGAGTVTGLLLGPLSRSSPATVGPPGAPGRLVSVSVSSSPSAFLQSFSSLSQSPAAKPTMLSYLVQPWPQCQVLSRETSGGAHAEGRFASRPVRAAERPRIGESGRELGAQILGVVHAALIYVLEHPP
jgi:hypothetical protein